MVAPTLLEVMERTRVDFPILTQEVRKGVPLIYLDNAATTQKPSVVLSAMDSFYKTINANVHRGVFSFSERATSAYEGARQKVQAFIGAASAHEIVFTRNTTEAINLVACAWGGWALRAGDEIVLSEMEHHANIVPWQMIAERTGAVVRYIPLLADGTLDQDAYRTLLESGRVRIVAVAHVSNVLGTINPIQPMIQQAHAAGALALIDAAQAVPHMPINVRDSGADFVAFSGHKMLGPTGIGVLYGRRELLDAMPPYMGGGSMIRKVTLEKTTYADSPQKFEAGTPAIAPAVGLGAAVDYLSSVGLEAIHAHETALVTYVMERMSEISGLTMYGPGPNARAGLVAFTLTGVHPHDLAQGLDSAGIAVRAGHHCAMPLHDRFKLAATTRASFYCYNTLAEADKLIEAILKVRQFFA
jgi:cysteine desulfurase/selenocysteine lyase